MLAKILSMGGGRFGWLPATRRQIGLIREAHSVPEAIDEFWSMKPNLVFLDMHMPSGGGTNVLSAVRTSHHAPITVVVTNDPHLRTPYLKAGAGYIFDKSAELDDFRKFLEVLPPCHSPVQHP